MKQERIIEIGTYVIVSLAMWVLAPWIGKLIDKLHYPYSGLFSQSPTLLITGGALMLLGFGLIIWAIVFFKTIGRGTPNPKIPPTDLVISGPYKYTRNPMVFGGFLFLLGESGIYQSPSLAGIAVLFAAILYVSITLVEEPTLRKRFGQPYEKYCKTVPRYFPKFFSSSRE